MRAATVGGPQLIGGRFVVRAEWSTPEGARPALNVSASGKKRIGAALDVWVDEAGREVAPPRARAHHQALGLAVLTLLGVAGVVRIIHRVVGPVLDWWRPAGWETE